MKPNFCFVQVLLAVLVWTLPLKNAQADHAQGSDLTYLNLAPNTYFIKYNFYRDCTGTSAGSHEYLSYRAPGCHLGDTLFLPHMSYTVGNPYCDNVAAPCSDQSNLPANFEEHIYSATLSLPAYCDNWTIFIVTSARNNSRNIYTSGSDLYTEALINNSFSNVNSSPGFTNKPVPYVCVNQPVVFSLNANDPDGDSLSYHLVSALNGYSSPVNYRPGYSAQNPFGPNASPALSLDSVNGTVRFTPTRYYGTPQRLGEDKYVVAVQINEWRKNPVTSFPERVGFVRRDIMVNVINCSTNHVPSSPGFTVNDTMFVQANSVVEVEPCNSATITFTTRDPNPLDRLTISSNATSTLPSISLAERAIFSATGGGRPKGAITWTPDASFAGNTYYFNVTIRDNACPIPGTTTLTLGIKVKSQKAPVDVVLASADSICFGEQVRLWGIISGDSSTRLVYPYLWVSRNGSSTDTIFAHTDTIQVKPRPGNTWYKVIGGCTVSDSVLVVTSDSITASFTAAYESTAAPMQVNFTNTSYAQAQIKSWRWSYIRVNADGSEIAGEQEVDFPDNSYNPAHKFKEEGTFKVILRTYAEAANAFSCMKEYSELITVKPFFLPNVFTPNGDGINDVFELSGLNKGASVKIFNRWGALVKEIKDYDQERAWNGENTSAGTYFYIVTEPGGKEMKGWVELIR